MAEVFVVFALTVFALGIFIAAVAYAYDTWEGWRDSTVSREPIVELADKWTREALTRDESGPTASRRCASELRAHVAVQEQRTDR